MQDRPDLIISELSGLAFDSLQQAFRACDLDVMFTQAPLKPRDSECIYIAIDPAAGGPQSDHAMVSITRHKGMVNFKGKMYSFPINLMTMSQIWGVTTPSEARRKIAEEAVPNSRPSNMEEWCLSTIGKTLYETFIEGYSTKQWNKHPRELPATIVKRLPVRFTFNDDYFHDLTYQGIPVGGYTKMVENMLEGVKEIGRAHV